MFYNTVVAQAQKIEVAADRVTFTFSAGQRDAARHVRAEPGVARRRWRSRSPAGRWRWPARRRRASGAAGDRRRRGERAAAATADDRKTALKEQALADAGVQALLEVFPAEIRDVEEM